MSAEAPAADVVLTVAPGVRTRRWGDEVVVYDSGSAQTHLLSGLIGEVFVSLHEAGARSCRDLEAWLSEDGSALDTDEQASLTGIIDDLVNLGLVDRSPS